MFQTQISMRCIQQYYLMQQTIHNINNQNLNIYNLYYFLMNYLEFIYTTSTPIVIIVILILYCLYVYRFKYFSTKMVGDYNVKLKSIGKIIPPFPNGWYIVAKSHQVKMKESKAIDVSGHNITLLRSSSGKVYGLHSYCAHLGANLGIGGKVVNEKCIQCPFHGWIYDGQTGKLVNNDGKPVKCISLEYDDDFGLKGNKEVNWKQSEKQEEVNLRKYHVRELHGFIYVWIHSNPKQEPQFEIVNLQKLKNRLNCRGNTIHVINSVLQDMPENGADVFHFRYVHKKPISQIECINFLWNPTWVSGDDPELQSIFHHKVKHIDEFKQEIYNNHIKDYKEKSKLSFANIDNSIVLPFFGSIFLFNLTVMQTGPGVVNVFLKTKFFTFLFFQYIISKGPTEHTMYHEVYCSNWLPYWLTSIMIYAEGIQVYNDLLIWDSKKFGYKFYLREDSSADQFIKKWRGWIGQFYEGCHVQLKKQKNDLSW